jgi:hypothetical protein
MRKMIFLSLAVLCAALLPLGCSNTNAQAFSVASLKGTCVWQEVKYPTTSGDQSAVGPTTILASVTFNGNGAMTLDYDANVNGTYTSTNGVQGTYSVDATGHGSFGFMSPATGIVRTYDFRVSSTGHTIYTIAQADGGLSVTQRVSAGSCRFQD